MGESHIDAGISVSDVRGGKLELAGPPERIVSLVPSVTETVVRLGAVERLVGRTRFCIHPEGEVEEIETVGGTKTPDLERIIELEPDLVLANREENRREHIKALEEAGLRCWVCFPRTRREGLELLRELGALTGREDEAEARRDLAGEDLSEARQAAAGWPERSYLFMIWRNPWMTVSGDTYVSDLLGHLKLVNAAEDADERYPELSVAEIERLDPDLLLLSTEPFPFTEEWLERVEEELSEVRAVQRGGLRIVDGEWAEWYGWRTPEALGELLPQLAPPGEDSASPAE